jgi:hypothetical protein
MKSDPQDERPIEETSERLDRALRRALKTPPEPHKAKSKDRPTNGGRLPSGRAIPSG